MAGKKDKDPKYLLGAVPEVNGVVTFQKSFSVTDKNEQQIYDVLLAYITDSIAGKAIQNQNPQYTRIISNEKENGTIVARIEEYMIFHKMFLSLDRTRFRYMLTANVSGQKVSLTITQISYYYNEDMDGKNGERYKAEEWITDKEAVNKAGTNLYPRSGKFRRKTIDRVQEIFGGFMEAFSTTTKQGVVEE
jgi:colicin import membrane protein